ncbi:unnamed protein product [Timema podura]|uniref:Uncharacterized protein n=1 Tax=Timema podura TaxID=61482 RepID=A0ABN7NVV8_TIMPD|nr:unnamed protein product [Timema podura]
MLQRIFQYVGVLPPFKGLHPISVRPPCLTLGNYKRASIRRASHDLDSRRSDQTPWKVKTFAPVKQRCIPPSSDDDRDSLQNEILSYSESVTRPPRRHGRICVPMSFSGIRKQMGKKRFRRYENVDWCSHRMVYPRQDWWELILDQQALYKLPKSLQHADTVAVTLVSNAFFVTCPLERPVLPTKDDGYIHYTLNYFSHSHTI